MNDSETQTRIHVAIAGPRMHYSVPRVLQQAGLLGKFFTGNYIGNKPWLLTVVAALARVAPRSFASGLLGLQAENVPPEAVTSFEWFGIRSRLRQRKHWNTPEIVKVFADTARSFNELVIRAGLNDAKAVYGLSGASLEIFQQAKHDGLRCILEQIAPPQRIETALVRGESERWPGWQLRSYAARAADPLAEREEKEWMFADCIIGASEFTLNGVAECGVSETKCRLVPYGIDIGQYQPKLHRVPERGPKTINVLFVGEVGLRKGVPYLLEALRKLDSNLVRARLAGPVALESNMLDRYGRVAKFLGPVPRTKVAQLYQWADVLVFPTVSDGFGLVQIEALASGIPVIASRNCGSVVSDGVNGYIIPVRDSDVIAMAVDRYMSEPGLLAAHKEKAVQLSKQFGLDRYGQKLVSAIREVLG